jgi:transposase
MANFRAVDRATPYLLPPSVEDWLPERHLARFVVEVLEQMDLSALTESYRGTGSAPYHPVVMTGLLIYGYATGVFSSRRIEQASYDSIAFRFIAANEHPDHDSLCAFRRRFLKEIEALFVQVLLLAREMGWLKLGTVALDGTKIRANASRAKALSYGHAEALEKQLRQEVSELLALAEHADRERIPDGMSIPEELSRREARLRAIRQAKAKIEARAAERNREAQAAYETKLAARREKEQRTGKRPGGKPPAPPAAGPSAKDQVNLTDEDSRVMLTPGGGFEQAYNAQAAVDTESLLIVGSRLSQAPIDQQQLQPMLGALQVLPAALGKADCLLADAGYFSTANVEACEQAHIEPLLAFGRERHHLSWQERFAHPPAPLVHDAGPVIRMWYRLQTPAGRARYAIRKRTIEPVIGIIKSVMGFRQFLLRGLQAVSGEWRLITMAWNLRRMFALSV